MHDSDVTKMWNLEVGDKLAYVSDRNYSDWDEVTVTKINNPKWYTRRNWQIITVSNGTKFWPNGDIQSNGPDDAELTTIERAEQSQPYRDKNTASRENSSYGVGLCGPGWYQS